MCQITHDDNELNEDDEFDWSLNEPVTGRIRTILRFGRTFQRVSLESKLVLIPFLHDCERRVHFLMNFYVQRNFPLMLIIC
jgi:hypothetical protein